VRAQAAAAGLSVHAIAGTHVVLFGFDLPKEQTKELLGFALKRTDKSRANAKPSYLDNFLLLKVNDKGKTPDHSSFLNPYQEFVWGDYTLHPDEEYEYEVTARYGRPGALTSGASVTVSVKTESEVGDKQDVFFNRGVAGSQPTRSGSRQRASATRCRPTRRARPPTSSCHADSPRACARSSARPTAPSSGSGQRSTSSPAARC
jgi:hypothetical protein